MCYFLPGSKGVGVPVCGPVCVCLPVLLSLWCSEEGRQSQAAAKQRRVAQGVWAWSGAPKSAEDAQRQYEGHGGGQLKGEEAGESA